MGTQNLSYIIFYTSDINLINFEEVCESSSQTLRLSINGEKTFVKWEDSTPSCIQNLTYTEGPFTHSEMLEILKTTEWYDPKPLP